MKIVHYLICLFGLLFFSGCEEFLEESIEDKVVSMLSPGEQAVIGNYSVAFLWNPLEHALSYRLQIATPDFDSVQVFLADTLVERTQFTMSLEPGRYAWRIKGINGSSEGEWSHRSFTVFESDLTNQMILLNEPADRLISNAAALTYSWQNLFGATRYRIQLDTNRFTNESQILLDSLVENNALRYQLLQEAEYQWRVRGESDTSISRWSAVRSFIMDRTPPAVPAFDAPANNARVNRPVSLRWRAVPDAVSYHLYVYKADSTTLFSNAFPVIQAGTSYELNAGVFGEQILWRLKAVDRAGNESAFSPFRSFTVGN